MNNKILIIGLLVIIAAFAVLWLSSFVQVQNQRAQVDQRAQNTFVPPLTQFIPLISPTIPPSPVPSVTPQRDVEAFLYSKQLANWEYPQQTADTASQKWAQDARLYLVEIHIHRDTNNPVNYVYRYYSPGNKKVVDFSVISGALRQGKEQFVVDSLNYAAINRSAPYFSPIKTLSLILTKIPGETLRRQEMLVLQLHTVDHNPVTGASGLFTGWLVNLNKTMTSEPQQYHVDLQTGKTDGI